MDKKMRILPPLLRKRKLIEVANSEEAIRELKARRVQLKASIPVNLLPVFGQLSIRQSSSKTQVFIKDDSNFDNVRCTRCPARCPFIDCERKQGFQNRIGMPMKKHFLEHCYNDSQEAETLFAKWTQGNFQARKIFFSFNFVFFHLSLAVH